VRLRVRVCVYPCIFNRTDRVGNVLERSLGAIAGAPEVRPTTGSLDRVLSLERLQCASCRLTACALFACSDVESRPPAAEVP
jgi:MoaA/NifB/PqqE/SkfB family radical SAM enzyme